MLVRIWIIKIVNVEKKVLDKLVKECTEPVKEVKIVCENKNKCSSCILYIVIFNNLYNQHWNCYIFCLL